MWSEARLGAILRGRSASSPRSKFRRPRSSVVPDRRGRATRTSEVPSSRSAGRVPRDGSKAALFSEGEPSEAVAPPCARLPNQKEWREEDQGSKPKRLTSGSHSTMVLAEMGLDA